MFRREISRLRLSSAYANHWFMQRKCHFPTVPICSKVNRLSEY